MFFWGRVNKSKGYFRGRDERDRKKKQLLFIQCLIGIIVYIFYKLYLIFKII